MLCVSEYLLTMVNNRMKQKQEWRRRLTVCDNKILHVLTL
jgi:hypothetical protein